MATNINPAYILFGMKYCGKTTLGRLLSEKLSYPFIDINDTIKKQTGLTPSDIYQDYGPGKFMNTEEQFCKVIGEKCIGKKIVIATGEIICDNAPALTYLRDLGAFIFLDVPETILADRMLQEAVFQTDGTISNLPAAIAKNKPNSEEDIRKLFSELYTQYTTTYRTLADITVPLADATAEENFQALYKSLDS
ncbi:MAG: hypothetical protein J6I73_08790 [Treponema sp.]|nr:hypothetical protein [Treponema sp.]